MKKQVLSFLEFIGENYQFLSDNNILEQSDNLSGLSSTTAFMGASSTPTTNVVALTAIKKSFDELKSSVADSGLFKKSMLNIAGEIKEGNSLFMSKGKLEIKPKTEKTKKDYLKIDEKTILDVINKEPVYKDFTFGFLVGKNLEVSGNGIFALGRLIKSRAKKMIDDETKVYIGLNLKNTDSFVANAKTGLQGPIGSFGQSIMMVMVASEIIVPNAANEQSVIKGGIKMKGNSEFISSVISNNAIPRISSPSRVEQRDELRKIGNIESVDPKELIGKYGKKRINGKGGTGVADAVKIYMDFYNTLVTPFMELTAERFKKFLDNSANEMGVPVDLFSDIKKEIDTWKSSYKVSDKVKEKATTDFQKAFNPTKESAGDAYRGATTQTLRTAGKESEI
jgi:hypothetical protein